MLTVLLATKDRASILSMVLESFCQLHEPPLGWKLVVVDNGSTDMTSQVLTSFADRLPLHTVLELKPGKNTALNTGLELAEGDLLVFTDDDVFPCADWLIQFRRAADERPEFLMFGGAIVPRWDAPPPAWLGWVRQDVAYSVTDPSLTDGEMNPNNVFGPNMAIRSHIFQSGTRFDTSIGPRGSSYPMGSETELILRLQRQGHKASHVRKAVVEHFVRKEQLKLSWVLQRANRYGRGQYRLAPSSKLWGGIPPHLFRDVPKEALTIAGSWLSRRQERLFRSRWQLNYLLGRGIEARNLTKERVFETPTLSQPPGGTQSPS